MRVRRNISRVYFCKKMGHKLLKTLIEIRNAIYNLHYVRYILQLVIQGGGL